MSTSNGAPVPPPPQDCTLYFYVWPCGDRRWVKCTKCSLNPPTNIEAHFVHEHKAVQLPDPKHKCPQCGYMARHQIQWVGINDPDARETMRELTATYNNGEQIQRRTEQDVYAKEYPWRIDATFMEEEEGVNELRNETMMNIYRTARDAAELEAFINSLRRPVGQEQQASSPPLGSDVSTPRPQPAQPSTSTQTTPRQSAPYAAAAPQHPEEGEIDEPEGQEGPVQDVEETRQVVSNLHISGPGRGQGRGRGQ